MFNITEKTIKIGASTLSIEAGRYARQADGAVMVRYGDTQVFVAAVMSDSYRDMGFLPLSVDYREKSSSAGVIPGGFFKREGRPTEVETLTARMVDRPIRPLFESHLRQEIQVMAMVYSLDKENDAGPLAITGASAALMISDIPWDGPVAAIKVGMIDGELVANPTNTQLLESDLDITVVVGTDGIVMVEGEADFLPDDAMVEALMFAKDQVQPILKAQRDMAKKIGKKKRIVPAPETDKALLKLVEKNGKKPLLKALKVQGKKARNDAVKEASEALFEALGEGVADRRDEFKKCWSKVHKATARGLLFDKGERIDGRDTRTVRPIHSETGVLVRTHGSAVFTRGETQVLAAVTLGTAQDEQRVDALAGQYHKHFMLHYNFPPFCVGEAKMARGPSRRDIGHGNLAERGTKRILPDPEQFPYTIRVLAEVLESNGSSSMGTVCSGTMALMDAGVPVKCMVAGIAMGLMQEGDKIEILTDILGDEDHMGDMDFKVVGSETGITAIQMDVKISGLSREILVKALAQATEARTHILGEMRKTISEARPEVSQYAPRIITMHINPDKIRDLIGPGGKHIRGIIQATGAQIDVTDDGTVRIAAVGEESKNEAIRQIESYTKEAEIGMIYEGRVAKVTDFGAFVTIMPGTDGLCHISEMAEHRVERVEDIMKEGDIVKVKVLEIDGRTGKIRLSHKAALYGEGGGGESDGGGGRDRDRGGRSGGGGRDRGRGRR
ncbi:MAG: polyribonucleotide nucleotidyltransferase [Pseudomonadota bacterium]